MGRLARNPEKPNGSFWVEDDGSLAKWPPTPPRHDGIDDGKLLPPPRQHSCRKENQPTRHANGNAHATSIQIPSLRVVFILTLINSETWSFLSPLTHTSRLPSSLLSLHSKNKQNPTYRPTDLTTYDTRFSVFFSLFSLLERLDALLLPLWEFLSLLFTFTLPGALQWHALHSAAHGFE